MQAPTKKEIESRVTLLKSISIFEEVDVNLLENIATALAPKFLSKGETLFKVGDKDYSLYLIVQGKVKVHIDNHLYAHFTSNQYIGEYSLIDSTPRSATVTAVEPSELLRLDQSTFWDLINKRSDIALAMLKGLVFRLRDYNKLEAELTQKNLEIEQQAKELEQQRTDFEALNSTKDKFFAIIAHDLKNPFSTVLGLSELLAREFESFDSDSLKNFISQIYRYSNNTYNLLENLLQWSMLQTGRMPMKPKMVNLNQIIEENVDLLSGNSRQKNIDIEVVSCSDCSAYVDSNQVTTVVRNLLSNAIKFTSANGKIVLTVDSVNDFWQVCIEDNGVGISSADLKKLFRIDSNPSRIGTSQEKGTGLGLILCKEFVEQNGGKIWVESKPGVGSKFCFTIPKVELLEID